MQYQKAKSVAKRVEVKGPKLEAIISETMGTISSIVGATLGPGGRPVLIERQEFDLPSFVTKDGVTVMRSLGFEDSVKHCILEAARDAAVRTAAEAGDGTTTATILAESVMAATKNYCKANPRVSPQKVMRFLEQAFKTVIEPALHELTIRVPSEEVARRKLLKSVAKLSANGDEALADAVIKCFEEVGDEGNVTIAEVNGNSSYEVELIDGFPIGVGLEDCCLNFVHKFINNPKTQTCSMEWPRFIVYNGILSEIQTVVPLLEKIGMEWTARGGGKSGYQNIVIVAKGFSDSVIAQLSINFQEATSFNVFPLVAPRSPIPGAQVEFLLDVAAIVGAKIFDPMNEPLSQGELHELGPGVELFEATRFRSNIIGIADDESIVRRAGEIEAQLVAAASELDRQLLQERLGKLTGGIARLKVIGASGSEIKEKRDRAEDAVCAVRGAIKHGCLPGGGWALVKIIHILNQEFPGNPMISGILGPALLEPTRRLISNSGLTEDEGVAVFGPIWEGVRQGKMTVYDFLEGKHGDAVELGVLDSTPAVLEAIRNSFSIAAVLGTLGGAVVFQRDLDLELAEARDSAEFVRNANANEADERG
jgi:chaperonin GroEL